MAVRLPAPQSPLYEPLSDADPVDVLGAITDLPYWLTASNHDVPELRPYLRGVIKAMQRAAPFHVYASEARTRIVAPRYPIEPVKAPRLSGWEPRSEGALDVPQECSPRERR
ncbi:putative antirestriction adenine methyltransferase [Streptomyces sp. NPDC001157]